jgi:hypothetical protein
MKDKIRFRDLSRWLKAAIIISWIIGIYYVFDWLDKIATLWIMWH